MFKGDFQLRKSLTLMNWNDSLNYFNNVLVVVKKLLIGLLIEPIGNEFSG